MGGIGSGGSRKHVRLDPDARYRQVWLDGETDKRLEQAAALLTGGSVSKMIKVTLQTYLESTIDMMIMEAK